MCCIFTCCGWMIDLVQRFWTFAMSCCISSAVCCALVTASMSGIAMGYNYSLAEYIDLKETNVSVYLKRGVFDDEIADDMDWRRSGHMPVEGHLRDSNLMTPGTDNEEMPMRSGRRMDDSLVMSDDQHKFEGSLMRLTVKPPSYKSTSEAVKSDDQFQEAVAQHPEGSIDQMKAIHSLLNMRRMSNERNTKRTPPRDSVSLYPDPNGRRMEGLAPGGVPMYRGPYPDANSEISRARLAVPDTNIGNPANWFIPKNQIPESYRRTMNFEEDYPNTPVTRPTYPQPIIFTFDMKRPTRPKPERTSATVGTYSRDRFDDSLERIPEDELQIYKTQLVKNEQDVQRLKEIRKNEEASKSIKSEEDYADRANKGFPIRKKRQLCNTIKHKLTENLSNPSGNLKVNMSVMVNPNNTNIENKSFNDIIIEEKKFIMKIIKSIKLPY